MRNKKTLQRFFQKEGPIIGMTIGSGLYYKYAENNQLDFIVVASASRFRQMGLNSLAGSMPFGNSNRMVFEFSTREILTAPTNIPVFFGLCATDPTIDLEEFLDSLIMAGFDGVCNLPTVLIMDGLFRSALEEAGISYQKEVEAIRIANKKGLLTIAMVQDAFQARQMIDAGCDILSVHFGAAKGGILGAKNELSLTAAAKMANEVFEVVKNEDRNIGRLLYGGPSKTPSSVKYLLSHTNASGFIGGYSIERLMIEETLKKGSIQSAFFKGNIPPNKNKADKENYVENLKKYIEQNYPDEINMKTICEQLHISRSYLSRQFRKDVGISYQDYLIDCRLNKAAELLIETTMAISEIANAVGYNTYNHFSKEFKKKRGIAPTLYRKKHKKT